MTNIKKNILITGASSGIGFELVNLFLQNNWQVIATTRNKEAFPLHHQNLEIIQLDLLNKEAITKTINNLYEKYHVIDGLINNAGYGQFGIFEEFNEEEINKQIKINFFGPLWLTKAILPFMRKEQKGIICYISSIVGENTLPVSSLYCSTKFALNGLVESFYYEFLKLGINVKLFLPGSVKTNFWKNSQLKLSDKNEYKKISSSLLGFSKKNKGSKPKKVAKKIYKAIIKKNKQLYYYPTWDAKAVHFLRKCLPLKLVLFFNRKFFFSF